MKESGSNLSIYMAVGDCRNQNSNDAPPANQILHYVCSPMIFLRTLTKKPTVSKSCSYSSTNIIQEYATLRLSFPTADS